MATAAQIEKQMKSLGNAERARFVTGYFKTGPGQYGEGDHFLGVGVPALRKVAKEHRGTPIDIIDELISSKWHEVRLLAVVMLAEAYTRGKPDDRNRIYKLYLSRAKAVNNWDLVDSSAPEIVGGHLLERSRAPLHKLVKSRNLWERRIAIVSTQLFIRNNDVAETFALSESLLRDPEDLIHKATGWMLREAGKVDRKALDRFLGKHAAMMPRTMLRYAIERHSATERKTYLAMRVKLPTKNSAK